MQELDRLDAGSMKGALEAMLFASSDPVSATDLAGVLGVAPGEVASALADLAAEYSDANRGFQLREVAGGWRLFTHPAFHDQVEALTMSTKIALFREGELVQVDKPLELYDNPCDLYTADFIGNPSINFVEASGTAGASGLSVDGVMGRLEFSREDMTPEAPASGDLKLVLGIRPEQITISREKTDAAQVEARVYAGMPAGSETLVSVRVGEKLITVKELGSTHYAGDETVYLSYPPKKVNVFDASTKRLIKYSR